MRKTTTKKLAKEIIKVKIEGDKVDTEIICAGKRKYMTTRRKPAYA